MNSNHVRVRERHNQHLTKLQAATLLAMQNGKTIQQIADERGVVYATVYSTMKCLQAKMRVQSFREAVQVAFERGLLEAVTEKIQ